MYESSAPRTSPQRTRWSATLRGKASFHSRHRSVPLSMSPKCAAKLPHSPNVSTSGLMYGITRLCIQWRCTVGSVTRNGSVPRKWLSQGVLVYMWCWSTCSRYQLVDENPIVSSDRYAQPRYLG